MNKFIFFSCSASEIASNDVAYAAAAEEAAIARGDSLSRDCGAGRRTQILAYATVQPRKWLDDVQCRTRLNSVAHERRARKS